MFKATNSNAIMWKWKNIFRTFFCISKIYIRFGILWKRRWASEVICFWNYRLQKAGLLKCLKSPLSEHLWTLNMLNGVKHCINLHSSIFVIFFDHSEKNQRWKLFLVVSEILRQFFNILTPDHKDSLSVKASVVIFPETKNPQANLFFQTTANFM